MADQDFPLPPGAKLVLPPGAKLATPAATPTPPAAPQTQEPPTIGGNLSRFMDLTWNKVNPWTQLQGMKEATLHPYMAVKGMLEAQGELAMKAKESFAKGDYASGLRHSIDYLIPLLGVELDEAGNKAAAGDIVGSLADTAGISINLATPAIASKVKSVAVLPALSKLTPKVTSAIRYLESEGVPVPAGVRTGSEFVQGAEKLSEFSPGGAYIAMGTKAKQAAKMAETGEKLAGQAHPTPVAPETAGSEVAKALAARRKGYAREASGAYSQAWANEADPYYTRKVQTGTEEVVQTGPGGKPVVVQVPVMEDVAFPVDMRQIKAELKPVAERLRRRIPPSEQYSSQGFAAVEGILKDKDFIPASVAEDWLSGLKKMGREAEGENAGRAKFITSRLQKAIDTAVSADPLALPALQRGRAQTARGHYVQKNILDKLLGRVDDIELAEPVRAFGKMVERGDTNIQLLRRIEREAPGELPKVGRAYLDELLRTATAEGGFSREAGMLNRWNTLGDQAKLKLFKDPKLVENLDNFFLGAKKLSEKVNPSGTALVGFLPAQAGAFIHDPFSGVIFQIGITGLAKLLKTPTGARLLAEGVRIPLGNKAAGGAIAAQLLRMAGDDAKKIEDRKLTPAMAQ